MNHVVLSGRNISMKYGHRVVLDNISIDIRAGEVTALLGPNGAGKVHYLNFCVVRFHHTTRLTILASLKKPGNLKT